MAATAFEVQVGSLEAKSGQDQGSAYLTFLSTDLGIGGVGRATIKISATSASIPSIDDDVTVKVDKKQVFAGHVFGIQALPDMLVITASDGLTKLAKLEVEGVYEDKTAGAIAKDIFDKAGVETGTVEDGPQFGSYFVHRGPRAMRHIEELALRSGFSFFTDSKGKIHFAAPKSGRADHTFDYSTHVIQIDLRAEAPANDGAIVWGEGAAGEKGADKAHWLTTKLSSLEGKASVDATLKLQNGQEGEYPLTVRDGAVRASADAKDQAKARMNLIASRLLRGFVEIIGDAGIEPGHLVKIDALPKEHPLYALANGKTLRVRRVKQIYNARRGFVTRMEF